MIDDRNLIEQIEGPLLSSLWPNHEFQFSTTLTNEVIVPIFRIFVKVVVKIVWPGHEKVILQLQPGLALLRPRCEGVKGYWQSGDKNTK